MGTRALIDLADEAGVITTIYRHNDGYPSGLGKELRSILGATKIINGIHSGQDLPFFANGMGCAAAYLIGQLKDDIGRHVVVRPGTRDMWEEYVYVLTGKEGEQIHCRCTTGGMVVFDGLLAEFHEASDEEKVDE